MYVYFEVDYKFLHFQQVLLSVCNWCDSPQAAVDRGGVACDSGAGGQQGGSSPAGRQPGHHRQYRQRLHDQRCHCGGPSQENRYLC